jgi:hypothetical protein
LKGDVSFNVLATVTGGLRNRKKQLYLNKHGPSANQQSKMHKDVPLLASWDYDSVFFFYLETTQGNSKSSIPLVSTLASIFSTIECTPSAKGSR